MHVHSTSQASLAADIISDLISLDAKMSILDQEDHAELAERLTALDASELRHIFDLLLERGIVLAAPVPVAPEVTEEASL